MSDRTERALGIALLFTPFAGIVAWGMLLFPPRMWLMLYGQMALVLILIGSAVAGCAILNKNLERRMHVRPEESE
jgi:hypothetical protein